MVQIKQKWGTRVETPPQEAYYRKIHSGGGYRDSARLLADTKFEKNRQTVAVWAVEVWAPGAWKWIWPPDTILETIPNAHKLPFLSHVLNCWGLPPAWISGFFWQFFLCVCVCARSLTKLFFRLSQPGSCAWLSPFLLCADCTCVFVCVCLCMCMWKCVGRVINI